MKYFYMALVYWAGTIFLVALFTALWGLFELSGFTVALSVLIFIFGAFLSFPIILPCMWLLRITARLPYRASAITSWFAVMLSLVYILFMSGFVALLDILKSESKGVFPFFSTISIFIMTYFLRNELKELYIQQTNQQ